MRSIRWYKRYKLTKFLKCSFRSTKVIFNISLKVLSTWRRFLKRIVTLFTQKTSNNTVLLYVKHSKLHLGVKFSKYLHLAKRNGAGEQRALWKMHFLSIFFLLFPFLSFASGWKNTYNKIWLCKYDKFAIYKHSYMTWIICIFNLSSDCNLK